MRTIKGKEVEVRADVHTGDIGVYVEGGTKGLMVETMRDGLHMLLLKRQLDVNDKDGAIITCFHENHFQYTGKYVEYRKCNFYEVAEPKKRTRTKTTTVKTRHRPTIARAVKV